MGRIQNPREVYGRTLVEIGREDPRIVVLEADLGKSTMSCYFEEAFPDRFFEMGIAEANMTSFAAGLALTGKIPFTNSFAVFAAGRAFDQIRQGICIPALDVRIVGSSCGLSDFGDGSTHQSVEDVAIMRSLPNMTVLAPADGNETRAMTRALAGFEGPVYMRITRNDLPDVMPEDEPFVAGKPHRVRQGSDAVVFASGQMVGPKDFARKICYDDLATGGSIVVFNGSRDVLDVAEYYMDFFIEESCGYCTPCRTGNVLLKQGLAKVRAGRATPADLDALRQLGETVKAASRCGLGQTSPNPVLTTLANFRAAYEARLTEAADGLQPTFDIQAALAASKDIQGRASVVYPA